MKTINFNPANAKQKLFMESTAKFMLLSGAVGAGKSLIGCWKGFMLNIIYPGNRGLICRKEMTSLKASTMITLLEQVIPPEFIVSFDRMEGVLKHKTGIPGIHSTIVFSGLDKKADQTYPTKIGSTEYGWIFADETTELTEDDFQVLSTRLRYKIKLDDFDKIKKHKDLKIEYEAYADKMVRQIFGATNPDSPHHYLYKFFYLDQKDNRLLIQTTPYDNPYLSADYLRDLEDTLTGIKRERLLLGKWVQAEGIIYETFNPVEDLISVNLVNELQSYKYFFGGADSNFPLPRAGVIFGVKANNEIHMIDEYYQTGSHPEDLGQWFSDFAIHWGVQVEVFHDPSDPEAITKINAYPGVTCEKGLNKVIPGIDCVSHLFEKHRLKINKCCVNSIKYLQSYVWKKGATQQPSKEDDHLPDAIRYALFTRENATNVEMIAPPEFM